MTCRTCGEVILKTNNDHYKIIPSFVLGWQQKINDNFGFSIGAGLQYFELPDVIVNNTKGDNLPPYVQKKIDSIIANTNEEYSRLIRSELFKKKPEFWEGNIYELDTIKDILDRQNW